MQIHELKGSLVKKKINDLYIFTGEEVGIMDIYVNKVANVGSLDIKRVDSLSGIFSKLTNNSIMSKPTCYVIRDDKEFLKAEKNWDNLGKFGGNVVIMLYTSLDKRSKFYKHYKDEFVEFEKLAPEVLARYVMKECSLSTAEAITMAVMCQCSYTRVMLEIDKLARLTKVNNCDDSTSFKMMKDEGLLFVEAEDVVFDLIDAICTRQALKSYALLDEFKEFTDSPLGAITLLYNNLRNMLIVQSFKDKGKGITESTGLTGWQVGMAKKKLGRYQTTELVQALRVLKETEKGIKIGWIESSHALDYILASML